MAVSDISQRGCCLIPSRCRGETTLSPCSGWRLLSNIYCNARPEGRHGSEGLPPSDGSDRMPGSERGLLPSLGVLMKAGFALVISLRFGSSGRSTCGVEHLKVFHRHQHCERSAC